ncbi:MAG: iron-containing redox enzyme family protein [Pseudomonadota bacterium]
MFIAAHEWSSPQPDRQLDDRTPFADLYSKLLSGRSDLATIREALAFLDAQICKIDLRSCDLPADPQDLELWMQNGTQSATEKYGKYLEERKAGSPRRFFTNRAHALYFLRSVAPTKLVDGSWLYGLVKHWRNPRFADLIRTYFEELGEGATDKNHVLIYRQLLTRHGLDPVEDLDESFYTQGLIQLALAGHAEEYLPEVIGFNLGYEQLPLHLLITAYELNELGIDPYYFTLHVTVDNSDTGHARRAVQAVLDNIPKLGGADEFWRRVRLGYGLSNAGVGTTDVIGGFNIEREVVRIFTHKSEAGHGAHSDYCRVGGRNVNDWLARKEDIPEFLAALEKARWIKRGVPVEESRFWGLLQGGRAEMFGVFTPYELQVIHDWILGEASREGHPYSEIVSADGMPQRASFRVAARLAATRSGMSLDLHTQNPSTLMLDSDLQTLTQQLPTLDAADQASMLVEAMAPSQHWTPAGLHATRLFGRLFFPGA